MKKLLPSKKTHTKTDCEKGYRCPPKRTIGSAWNIRNDSSSICSVLQPEAFTKPTKQTHESQGVYKKCLLSDNTCYCKEDKIKPKLMSRPKTCLSLENLRRQLGISDLVRRPIQPNPSIDLEDCLCKDADTTSHTKSKSVDLALLMDHTEEFPSHCDCLNLKYTQSRADYEWFRKGQAEEDMKELENYQATEDDKQQDEKQDESYALSTILGTRWDTAKTISSYGGSAGTPRTVDDLNAFRSDHYFDTHSTHDLEKTKDSSSHTCVHKFKLDDRLLPEPLIVDSYGRSRCSVCSKPMEGDTVQLSRSYFGERPSKRSLRNLAKCSELGLVPRSISIGGERSKVELQVDPDERKKFGMFVGKIRRPEYFNTYALRQQKMAC